MADRRSNAVASRGAWLALVIGVALIVVATWLILSGENDEVSRRAGIAVAGSGVALVVGGLLAHRLPEGPWRTRWWFAESAADRLFDGAVLGAIAWTARDAEPEVAAGALVAIGAGFLGSYVRARGAALGYGVEESQVTLSFRYELLALFLLGGWLSWGVWAVAGISAAAALVRSSQVAKEERA
jgi:hypothetical protein